MVRNGRYVRYARYEDDEGSGSAKTLLIAAGVIAGVIAGAAAAQRLGGWRGISRRLRRGRGPLLDLLRDAVSPEMLGRLLQGGGLIELLAGSPARKGEGRRRPVRRDPDLDEYEVEEWERAAAGVDQDDDVDEAEDGEEETDEIVTAEDIEREVLASFRQSRALSRRPIEISCDDDGVVELRGVVHSERELRLARRLARDVEGVVRVETLLEVEAPQAS